MAQLRALRFELLEDRRVLAGGVTVITHGAQLTSGLPDWTVTMGQAILDRADGALIDRSTGSMFQHDPATGLWNPVGGGVWSNSNAANQHIVLLYNWSSESGAFDDGWLEGAADNLFATLLADNANLAGTLKGRRFIDAALDAGGGAGLLDLHLIGHSRGAVLNSLVTERFAHFFDDLTIDQVTSLDGHPASPMNDPGYVGGNPSANSRLFTYDNVRFADNYFQQDGSYEPILPPDFDGVLANGAFNLQLPSAVLQNGGSSLEHSDVHSWYYGTITTPFAATYAGFSGAGRNHDGDVSFPEAWWSGSGVTARATTGFNFSRLVGGSRAALPVTGAKTPPAAIPTVFNGDMSLAIDGFFSDSLPGWEEHAGAGSGPLGGSDVYFELNSGGSDYFRRHNPLYVDRNSVAVEYDYQISASDASPDDLLQVLVNGAVIDVISLATATPTFVRDRRALLGFAHTGFVAALEFRILDARGDGVESAVRIDNVEAPRTSPPTDADFNNDRSVDGADFLAWQRGLGTYLRATLNQGDADLDGNVLADDLATWKASFGAGDQLKLAADARHESLVLGAEERIVWPLALTATVETRARPSIPALWQRNITDAPAPPRLKTSAPPLTRGESLSSMSAEAVTAEAITAEGVTPPRNSTPFTLSMADDLADGLRAQNLVVLDEAFAWATSASAPFVGDAP